LHVFLNKGPAILPIGLNGAEETKIFQRLSPLPVMILLQIQYLLVSIRKNKEFKLNSFSIQPRMINLILILENISYYSESI